MKYLLFLSLFIVPQAFAEHCVVYGISDSPQKMDCTFRSTKVNLRCVEGQYQLNGVKVETAFHMEVEEGPVPLVFKTPESQLTVLIESDSRISAEWENRGRTTRGSCRF